MTEDIATEAPALDEAERKALATRTSDALARGKVKIEDVWAALLGPKSGEAKKVDRTPPKTLPITDAQRKALNLLPKIYGKVAPAEDRLLTDEEAAELIAERGVIDVILALLTKRKGDGIRETIAMHCDNVLIRDLTEEEVAALRLDDKGHFQIKQDVSIPGTGMKIQKTISDPKPVLDMGLVQAAHDAGEIDRATYLSITSKPDLPRVLDEAKVVKAVKANPDLLWTLAKYTTTGTPITTIKVAKDT